MASERPFIVSSFYQFTAEGRLMASRCRSCSALWLPPRPMCVRCYRKDMEWIELCGRGKLVTFTVIPYGPMPMVLDGYGRGNPYCSGVVELEEGPRICAQIVGVNTLDPGTIKVGAPVMVEFAERSSWHYLEECYSVKRFCPVFRAV